MPEYLYPGVYVEEIPTGNKPIEGVSTSTVGFLGIAERGPSDPQLITSFSEFVRSYGSYFQETDGSDRYLAYGVEGFFLNGGKRCYVQRVTRSSALPANSTALAGMTVTAVGPGGWGTNIGILISKAGIDNPNNPNLSLFRMTIQYWAGTGKPDTTKPPTQTEDFDNLSINPKSSTFYEAVVNGTSNLVTLKQTDGTKAPTASTTPTFLTTGTDGTGKYVPQDFLGDPAKDPGQHGGLMSLEEIDDISILCCPDEHVLDVPPAIDHSIIDGMVGQCLKLKDRFAILQAPLTAPKPGVHYPPTSENYAAYYYPWLMITNAVTGAQMLIPPGGHMAGIYARSDTNRGVHKDPANEQILGIDSLQLPISNEQQSSLNPLGINVLRYFRGSGNLVWGGRTTGNDPDWRYINVRRLFIFIEKSIQRGTQWAVFEPNDQPLWAALRRSVGDFLTRAWMDGMLQGATKEQAYFVKCDRTTMTQADLDNGRLIMVIGIAPVKPAEFVIFRIGQWTGGSDVTEG